ncbi:MAG: DUF561 domain-containing protein [Bacilli bacterium]|nr:DUF561 domain-containing protein [Bacilli bacterium]MDD3895539.1 DUF561 domain-containing protein [Bacilli bacterium]MDD4407519.1 DUF561 domain-containing protein [Bacilli bacterium]
MKITELLNIKYPILQGAMAHISYAPLVSAVSNAGGLGIIASGGMTKDDLKNEIIKCKNLTNNPFGVNLMLMEKNCDDLVKIIIEEKVQVVTTGAGSPERYLEAFKKANIIVIPVVSKLKHAIKMEKLGVDAIIVEGSEAGGHIGETSSMVLIPEITKHINIPVIAAGGICDESGLLAAIALGASGIQMGTRFLASHECPAHINYKNAIINAKEDATVIIFKNIGAPVRCLKNNLTDQYFELEKKQEPVEKLKELTTGALKKAAQKGDALNGSLMCGQVASNIDEIQSVNDIIQNIMNNYTKLLSEIK